MSVDLVPDNIRSTWYEWKVQVFIVIGLIFQIILMIFSSRRKYVAKIWIRVLVWSAYLGAEWMALLVLGNFGINIFEKDGSINSDDAIQTIWLPFILLQLGRPDNISAYSLLDNRLWLRGFLEFIFRVWVVSYLFLIIWSNAVLSLISIPLLVSGTIKYAERAFVLRSSSSDHFKESLLSNPDPCRHLLPLTQEEPYTHGKRSRSSRREKVDIERGSVQEAEEESLQVDQKVDIDTGVQEASEESRQVIEAFILYKRFAHLFAGLVLDDDELKIGYKIIKRKSAKDAFNLVAIELGIMYDVLYTKAAIVYSRMGFILRCITFFSPIFTLIAFSIMIDLKPYHIVDIVITYSLLVVAVVMEVYAVIEICSSDWATLILSTKLKKAKCLFSGYLFFASRKRWSEAMGQFSLIEYYFKDMSAKYIRVQRLPFLSKMVKYSLHMSWKDVSIDLKEKIFQVILEKISKYKLEANFCETDLLRKILGKRGDYVLEEKYDLHNFDEYIQKVEFEHSLLLWHIATDLCYYKDVDDQGADNLPRNSKLGKCLSDYMLYLLVVSPYMMPQGIGELRFRDTCDKVTKFFESLKPTSTSIKKIKDYCKELLKIEPNNLKGPEDHMSALVDGCRLAKQLQSLESELGWTYENRWEVITEVWVEMLVFAANECKWTEHGYQLRKGGELLTHVRLLLIHLGVSEQYNLNGRLID